MKKEMLRCFLMWIGLLVISSLYADYIVSRAVNGYIQLLGFVGLMILLMYVGNETIKLLFNTKKEEK